MNSVLKINVRKVNKEDINKVTDLWHKLAIDQLSQNQYNKHNKDIFKSTNQQAYFENCLKDSNCEIFVAEYDKILIGFAEIWLYKKDFIFDVEDSAYIMHFFVDKTLKLNINPLSTPLRLFKACENWAIENNLKYLCSDVYGFNTHVQRLLEIAGAKPYKIRYAKRLDV